MRESPSGPVKSKMLHPLAQPSNLRVKGSPSLTSKLRFWKAGLTAETVAAKAERATKEAFILIEFEIVGLVERVSGTKSSILETIPELVHQIIEECVLWAFGRMQTFVLSGIDDDQDLFVLS